MKRLLFCLPWIALAATCFADSYTIPFPDDFSFIAIANQLDHGGNTLEEVLPNPPEDTVLVKWDCLLQDWDWAGWYYFSAGQWFPPGGTLAPGEGALIGNSSGPGTTLTFTGTPHVPVLPITPACGCGQYSLVSCQTNGLATFESITGFPPSAGAQLRRWDSQAFDFGAPYTFSGVAWSPSVPHVNLGEAVLILQPCPSSPCITIQCASDFVVECSAAWDFTPPAAFGTCCGSNVTLTILRTRTNGVCPRFISRVWQATDDCAHSSTCTQMVTVVDTTPPVIACAGDKTVECGSAWTFDKPTAIDGCCGTNVTVTITKTMTNGFCPKIIRRAWLATDCCGNSLACTQTVTAVDTTAPDFICSPTPGPNLVPNPGFEDYTTCPDYLAELDRAAPWFQPTGGTSDYFNACANALGFGVPANGQGYQAAHGGQAYAFAIVCDPSDNPTLSYREYIGTTLSAPLLPGRTYEVSFYVSLTDRSGYATDRLGAYLSVGPIPYDPDAVGNYYQIDVSPQVENPSGSYLASHDDWMLVQGTFVASGWEDHLTIGNFHNNQNTSLIFVGGEASCNYYFDDVTVREIYPPCTGNLTVECGAAWEFTPPSAADACSGTNVTVSILSTSTNGLCPQVVTRIWTATDACGNSNSFTQTVTVLDHTPPVITCVGDKTVEWASVWSFDDPSAQDSCCRNLTIMPLDTTTNGTGPCLQIITRTWQATDCCTNSAVCTQTVTVADTTAPSVVSVAADRVNNQVCITFSEPVNPGSAALASNYFLDNGAAVNTAVIGPPNTVCLSTTPLTPGLVYTLTVSGVADLCANVMNIAQFNLDCLGSIVINADYGTSAVVNYGVPGGSNVVCNPPPGTFPVGTTAVVCCDIEPGKTNCCSFTVTVIGSTNRPPVASCQGTVVVSADASCQAKASVDNGSFDPDAGDTITLLQSPPGPYPLGTNIVTLLVTDSHGATNSCTATVVVLDTTPPSINCPSNIVVATDPGQCSAVVTYSVTASDTCSGAAVNVNIYSGHTTDGGGTPYSGLIGSFAANGVTFATDTGFNWHPFGAGDFGADITGCLNVAADGIYSFDLNSDDGSLLYIDGNLVVDNGGPHSPAVASGSAALVAGLHTFEVQFYEDFGGGSGVDLGLPAGVTYVSCGVPVTCDPPSGSAFPAGVNTVTCVAADPSGNTNSCSFTVTVEDHEAPLAACREATNPDGKKIPTAGKNPKSGQNPDGFYQVLGRDNCDANPACFIQDNLTGYLFGPFASGTIVKITQSNHDRISPMAGVVLWHIQTVGDALCYAVDASGNVGAAVSCLVPKPPK